MADNQGQKDVEEQAQQSAVPTEEQKGQEIADSQTEVQETEESFEAPAGESEGELPKSVTERTREQFDKLRARLKGPWLSDKARSVRRKCAGMEVSVSTPATPATVWLPRWRHPRYCPS